jgi:hypothetical protein
MFVRSHVFHDDPPVKTHHLNRNKKVETPQRAHLTSCRPLPLKVKRAALKSWRQDSFSIPLTLVLEESGNGQVCRLTSLPLLTSNFHLGSTASHWCSNRLSSASVLGRKSQTPRCARIAFVGHANVQARPKPSNAKLLLISLIMNWISGRIA